MSNMKYNLLGCLLLLWVLFPSCEDRLDVAQRGVQDMDSYYQTDDEANAAIDYCYSIYRSLLSYEYTLKNMLSDEAYAAGGSRSDNSSFEQLNEYLFTVDNSYITYYFTYLYTLVYNANVVLERVTPDTDIKSRCVSEAYFFRAWAYINLIIYWGTPPYVDHTLGQSEYQQPNGDPEALWALVESDLNNAIDGALTVKSNVNDKTSSIRVTKEAAETYLGKAYLFQGKYSEAATALKKVIDSGLYALDDTTDDHFHVSGNYSKEYILFTNHYYDATYWYYAAGFPLPTFQWRFQDTITADWDESEGSNIWISKGYGFLNPTEKLYNAFESGDKRRKNTVITWDEAQEMGFSWGSKSTLYGCEGYLRTKCLCRNEDVITEYSYSYEQGAVFCYPYMRYANVLLMAAEACLQSGDQSGAYNYLSQVRTRAGLTTGSTVTLDDIIKERQTELAFEGVRYEDCVRWGIAAEQFKDNGKQVPSYSKGSASPVSWTDYSSNNPGFQSGKHELLPFPEDEIVTNQNITQNPGY